MDINNQMLQLESILVAESALPRQWDWRSDFMF